MVKNFTELNIPLKTTHDCFECPHIFAAYLRRAIYEAYIYTINQNYLTMHFKETNKIFYDLIQREKELVKYNWVPIEIEHIPTDASTLVK